MREEKPDVQACKVDIAETEEENLSKDLMKTFQSSLGIKPRTVVSKGNHGTTTACRQLVETMMNRMGSFLKAFPLSF